MSAITDTLWTPAGTSSWHNAANWNSGPPAVATEKRGRINNGGTAIVTGKTDSAGIILGFNAAEKGTLIITNSTAVLSNNLTYIAVAYSGTGIVHHYKGSLVSGCITNGVTFYMGNNASSSTRYNLYDGSTLLFGTVQLGSAGNRTVFNQYGGTFKLSENRNPNRITNTGRMFFNHGMFNIYGGTLSVTGQAFHVGANSSGNVTLTLDGVSATIECLNSDNPNTILYVGNVGRGRINLKRGLIRTNGGMAVGSSHTGVVVQTGGTLDLTPKAIAIGLNNTGDGTYMLFSGVLIIDKLAWPDRCIDMMQAGRALFLLGNADGRGEIRENTAGTGFRVGTNSCFRGWSYDGVSNSFKLIGPVTMNGRIIADGYGIERTLMLTGLSSVANSTDNGSSQSNGWYALNKGKLSLPAVTLSSGSASWGEPNTDTEPDLVNAARLTFTGATSGKLSGSLLAANRSDVPQGDLQAVSVHSFSGVSGFSSFSIVIRYDHVTAASCGIPENKIKIFFWNGAFWKNVTTSSDTNSNTITAAGLTSMGTYSIGRLIPKGAVFLLL